MQRSPFALISLVAGSLLFIPALLIAIIDGFGLTESNPLVVIGFPIVFLFSLPEAPVQMFPNNPGFPIILPLIAVTCAIVSMKRQEARRSKAVAGIMLTIISLAVHVVIKMIYA